MVTKVRGASSQTFQNRADMKAYDAPDGAVLYLNEGGRSGEFAVKTGTPPSDPQEGIYVVLDNGNYAMRRFDGITNQGGVNASWFGIVDDFDYVAKTGTDNYAAFQAALDTNYNVVCPAGSYGLDGDLQVYPQQVFTGEGRPQRGAKEQIPMSELIWLSDTNGISTVSNNANGASVENFVLRAGYQGSVTSTSQALNYGTEGATGGTSQQIKASAKNILTFDWFDGMGIHGFGYEVIAHNVLHSGFIRNGFRITDQSNIVSLYDCGGLGSQGNGGDAKAFFVSQAYQVAIYSPRAENNRVGIECVGGALVNMYNAYFEGNRIIDVVIDDPRTTLNIDGFAAFHSNDGATTTAIFQINGSADQTSSLSAKNIYTLVTKGLAGNDNDLSQFVLNNGSPGWLAFENIDWQAVGLPYAGSGKAPDLLTFRQLPHLRIEGRGIGSSDAVGIAKSVVAGSPADSVFELTNYDATTQLVGKETGARVYRMDTSTVDFYYWDGAAWTASSK